MAELQGYPQGTEAVNTMLVGTQMDVLQADGTKKNLTRNFSVGQISTLITKDYTEITRTLTNAEWLALPTTSIVVIPSQGPLKAIKVIEANLRFNFASTNFFFPGGITIGSGTVGTNSDSKQCFLPGGSSAGEFGDIDGDEVISLATKNSTISLNGPLYLGGGSGTNAGDGTVDLILKYQVI